MRGHQAPYQREKLSIVARALRHVSGSASHCMPQLQPRSEPRKALVAGMGMKGTAVQNELRVPAHGCFVYCTDTHSKLLTCACRQNMMAEGAASAVTCMSPDLLPPREGSPGCTDRSCATLHHDGCSSALATSQLLHHSQRVPAEYDSGFCFFGHCRLAHMSITVPSTQVHPTWHSCAASSVTPSRAGIPHKQHTLGLCPHLPTLVQPSPMAHWHPSCSWHDAA